jgi:hypothetical protein
VRSHPFLRGLLALAILCLALLPSRADSATPVAPALSLAPEDLRIEQTTEGSYILFVRAKQGLGSILITESTSDPSRKADTYALRDVEKQSLNGEGTRIVGGKSISSAQGLHFLIDSSPESDIAFGRAFHILIPWVVAWGYPWSRSGREIIHDGSFINIRAFAKPFADYSGAFSDNPYLIRVSQTASRPIASPVSPPVSTPAAPPVVPPVSPPAATPAARPAARPAATPAAYDPKLYVPETISAFAKIAKADGGELRFANSDQDIAGEIDALLERERGRSLDFVLCLDTTNTMAGALEALKASLPAALAKRAGDFPALRLGLVAYKDYFEEYLYKRFDFVAEASAFGDELDTLECGGGRDGTEAVYEALYAASTEFPWSADASAIASTPVAANATGPARLTILVGDAPPHPMPRGSVDESDAEEAARSASIELDAVAVPK